MKKEHNVKNFFYTTETTEHTFDLSCCLQIFEPWKPLASQASGHSDLNKSYFLGLKFIVYNTLYWDLKWNCTVYFPLFLFVHVLVEVFMKPLMPNLLQSNISVKVKYGQECRLLQQQKKVSWTQEMHGKCNINLLEICDV